MNAQNIKKAKIILAVYLIALLVFPFIFMLSVLSEIVADTSLWQQILYVTPALTVLGIALSVTLRRCGYRTGSLLAQGLFVTVLLIVPL